MDIRRGLTERDPDNSDWLRDLSVSLYSLASIMEVQGRLPEALEQRQADLAIAERLVALDPTNLQWQNDLKESRQALEALNRQISPRLG